MRPIRRDELIDLTTYERVRGEMRREAADLRTQRRLPLGERVSIVFDNHKTVLHQLQEALRTGKIVEEAAVQHELETFNELLPQGRCLSGTLFLELSDPDRIREEMEAFSGLDRGEHLWIDLGQAGRVPAHFVGPQDDDSRLSCVHSVRFAFRSEAAAALRNATMPVSMALEHPSYSARAPIEGRLRRLLVEDVEEG